MIKQSINSFIDCGLKIINPKNVLSKKKLLTRSNRAQKPNKKIKSTFYLQFVKKPSNLEGLNNAENFLL